jgi:hypothetical protein
MGWWLKGVLLMQWESEDEFFPGLANLSLQKTYLMVEMFFPWIVVAINNFYVDSVYFLILVVGGIVLFYIVDHWLKAFHEHSQMMKASTLLTIPFAIGYFEQSYMTFSELVWSMTMYYLCMSLTTRAIYGIMNIILKYDVLGLNGNPYHVDFSPVLSQANTTAPEQNGTYYQQLTVGIQNRIHEMEALNDCELMRLKLFIKRIQFPRALSGFRRIQPLLCMTIVSLGGALCVSISGWLTTVMYNGRVSECWKKALTRMVVPESKKPPQPPEDPRLVREVFNAPIVSGGSIAASLPNTERPKSSKVSKRLHAGQQRQEREAKDQRDRSDSEGGHHGSLPTFSTVLQMEQAPNRAGRSPSTLIEPPSGNMEDQPRSYSKSPVSFLDIFARNAPKEPKEGSSFSKK